MSKFVDEFARVLKLVSICLVAMFIVAACGDDECKLTHSDPNNALVGTVWKGSYESGWDDWTYKQFVTLKFYTNTIAAYIEQEENGEWSGCVVLNYTYHPTNIRFDVEESSMEVYLNGSINGNTMILTPYDSQTGELLTDPITLTKQ